MTSRPDDDADARVDGASEIPAASEDAAAPEQPRSAAPAVPAPVDARTEDDEATDDVAIADRDAEPERVPVTIDRDDVQVQARLVPRYGRFMVLGAIVGVVGGWLWSRLGSSGPLLGVGPVIDTSAMVPFLIAVGALAGVVLGAVLAIVLDRLVGRRKRTLTAERTRHHRGDAD